MLGIEPRLELKNSKTTSHTILRKEVSLQTSDACMTDKLAGNYKSIISYLAKFVYIRFVYLIGRKSKIL